MDNILIGIDPGVHTGFAIYDGNTLSLDTLSITRAMGKIIALMQQPDTHLHIFIEDARRRKWFGNAGREKLMGAGSIMRDSRIWEDFCQEQGLCYTLIAPQQNRTKLSAEQFQRITGYTGQSSEHNRDAAMLVFGRDPGQFNPRPQSDFDLMQSIINAN